MKKVMFVLCCGCFGSVSEVGASGFLESERLQRNLFQKVNVASVSDDRGSTKDNVFAGEFLNKGDELEKAVCSGVSEKSSDLYGCEDKFSRDDVEEITGRMASMVWQSSSSYMDGVWDDGEEYKNLIVKQSFQRLRKIQQEQLLPLRRENEINQHIIDKQSQTIISQNVIIDERDQTIREQGETINNKNREIKQQFQEVNLLKKRVEEKDQQIQRKDSEYSIVVNELESYKSLFNKMKETSDIYAEAVSGEFKRAYDNESNPFKKVLMSLNQLMKEGAERAIAVQQVSVSSVSSEKNDLNTIQDATRHDFLTVSDEEDSSFSIGEYKYEGNIDNNGKPFGEGVILGRNSRMKIKGTFSEGFLDIEKPIIIGGQGFNDFEFSFPKSIIEGYRNLISLVDISERSCSFGVQTLILKHSNVKEVNFVFNKDYVYVGGINSNDKLHGQGIRFRKNGVVQVGIFSNGFFVKESDTLGQMNPSKRKRMG